MNQSRINPMALGLSLGILSAIGVVIVGLIGYFLIPDGAVTASMGSWHIEYKKSLLGIGLAALASFINAFIGGALIAWLYNIFLPDFIEGEE